MRIDAEFVKSAAGAGDFPGDRLPETAFVGRSNVGKSALINALARRTVARTSAAPGKTRLANFYRVQRGSGPPMYLVDLPGYGYARAARAEPPGARTGRAGAAANGRGEREAVPDTGAGSQGAADRRDAAAREFARLTDAYFARAETPIATVLLVDSRHPGLESDLQAWEWLKTLPYPRAIVGTKVDKLTRAERVRNTRQLASLFDVPVLLVSAQDGEGLEELWKLIARLPSRTAA